MGPLVVTAYTPDYAKHACHLREDCERLGLELYMMPYEDRGDWAKNCLYKPTAIANALRWRQCPMLWIDADAKLLRRPQISKGPAFAGCPSRAGISRIWCGGTIYVTTKALPFVLEWQEMAESCDTDEEALNKAWTATEIRPSFVALPREYAWMPVDGAPGPDVIIQHRLSGNVGRFNRRQL